MFVTVPFPTELHRMQKISVFVQIYAVLDDNLLKTACLGIYRQIPKLLGPTNKAWLGIAFSENTLVTDTSGTVPFLLTLLVLC